jgi:hypothetical protein
MSWTPYYLSQCIAYSYSLPPPHKLADFVSIDCPFTTRRSLACMHIILTVASTSYSVVAGPCCYLLGTLFAPNIPSGYFLLAPDSPSMDFDCRSLRWHRVFVHTSDSPLCTAVQHGYTALHWAAQRGNDATCSLLLDRGANLTAKTNVPLPLYIAMRK